MINLVGWFGSTKSQSQMNTTNPDVRNKNPTFSASLPWKKQISLLSSANYIFFFFETIYLLSEVKKNIFCYLHIWRRKQYWNMLQCVPRKGFEWYRISYLWHYMLCTIYLSLCTQTDDPISSEPFSREAHIVASSMK